MTMNKVRLGDMALDTITGYEGIVEAETLWLNGCRRLSLQAKGVDDKGKVRESYTTDETTIELVESAAVSTRAHRRTGGPPDASPEPIRDVR